MNKAELSSNPAYQLWLATNAWQRCIRKALEPFDITHCQFVVLASVDLLTEAGELATQVAVHRFALIDENMTSQVVKALRGKGLINREPHPTDGRGHVLALTQTGLKLLDDVRNVIRPAKDDFFSPVGDDLEQLTSLLRKLNES
jgi:DNA-binding MarR family transcriptional regulator